MYNNLIGQLPTHQATHQATNSYNTRRMDQIKMIIVHHFAWDTSIERVAKMHVEENGWPGIGYHIVINDKAGINLCNSLDTVSYHCGGHNTRSVGIALAGDFSHSLPTPYMLAQLSFAIDLVEFAVGRDLPVFPHSTFRPTECPGDPIRNYMKQRWPDSAVQPLITPTGLFDDLDEFDDDYLK